MVMPHLGDAFSLARWLTGNQADAEDVTQDAAIRALRAIDSMRGDKPRAWLLSIVRNTAYSWLAKNRPAQVTVTDDEQVFEDCRQSLFAETHDTSPEIELIQKADARRLQATIDALPPAYREVLVLRELENLNYREIAALLSVPVGTVMSRLSRARALLFHNFRMAGQQAERKS